MNRRDSACSKRYGSKAMVSGSCLAPSTTLLSTKQPIKVPRTSSAGRYARLSRIRKRLENCSLTTCTRDDRCVMATPRTNRNIFEQFNRPNVDIVDLRETPITHIEPKGIYTSDGTLHELDVLILATGFDAVEGNYTRCSIRGRDGLSLKDVWKDSTNSSGFPNLFTITGPKGPFTNIPPTIEAQVEWATSLIKEGQKEVSPVIEATQEGEQKWSKLCDELAANSLFWKAEDNWIFRANVSGKARTLRWVGTMKSSRSRSRQDIRTSSRSMVGQCFEVVTVPVVSRAPWCIKSLQSRQKANPGTLAQ
ncbi:Cyclohexanone 1,2-monooxygenase [Fulvia fulva]|uniref:Cyclohexanone 1,2-monooxygenase n=1 Tax=Passalora fulva TaxID=5499 RepID=A0A9Q8L685_PASFU|nr:Cyclohexanone 1,2-monooxygenase [Fulvia fulva]KAK4634613.1 Cyclohexanone 1,2-monooxygenase [Fulvia fulva]KAK4638058.1 Cyclohexanone 1,2-monooxygenase [Fulvia fulva]UJO11630.1 Cyclohexanone 1,2-monooxygenase [Fulvia fulva]WPV08623.1 Cyclohexanone 1,2-monooxygenase [Fulvia fulva]WPV23609.1 Cyclohexanone 1,2-monooxygenase [Fulvia fulva]